MVRPVTGRSFAPADSVEPPTRASKRRWKQVASSATVATASLLVAAIPLLVPCASAAGDGAPSAPSGNTLTAPLERCIELALQNNHERRASRFTVDMAEAQHRQALSGYWPQVTLRAAYQRTDEPPNFLFPAANIAVPAQSINVPASTALVTVPANAFAPGFPPANVQMPVSVPEQNLAVDAQNLPVPEQDVKLMDEDSLIGSAQVQWLLFDGGMRRGLRQQAKSGIAVAKQGVRRTDLQIVDSVTRLYHGAILARKVHQVGRDTLARMEATLSLTETMYKEGAGRVKKTDYLDNKVMVETLRSAVALLEKNEVMAQAALAYTMGMSWDSSVIPADDEIPYQPCNVDLTELVDTAYVFSPDWASLKAGIAAAEGALLEARSAHYPKLALTGEIHQWWNDYDAGMATDVNAKGWSVGVGLEVPLFRGGMTRNKVLAAKARLGKIKEERFLLREGIGLQVRDIFLGMDAARKRHQATLDAMTSAAENRDLNTRAYQNDLVDTEDVIRAQLMEAFMSAQHYKMRYDHAALLAKLNLVVGSEVSRALMGE